MKLSISNIAWEEKNDVQVYKWMKQYGFTGLEIAPTRIFPESPYEKLTQAKEWSEKLWGEYGFVISSMQSIWYGKNECLFGAEEERRTLLDYTRYAVDFAEAVGCRNLVFGCPRNRAVPDGGNAETADPFFKELGDYASEHGTAIGMEANPPIYNTNYINDTLSALELIHRVDSQGFRLNLDVGTMIQNGEKADELVGNVKFINHVHISEPGLKTIENRELHLELCRILKEEGYDGFISIEMGKKEDISFIEDVMKYVQEIFG